MNPAQQEQLTNVGAYLRDLRKERGLAVDEVANQIFIRPALVKAIETGDWESLPEPVFVQGFIRRYAEYLGLNGKEVAQKFEPTPVAVLPDPELASSSMVEGVVKQQDKHGLKVISKAESSGSNGTLSSPTSAQPKWNWALGLAGLAILVGLIAWLTTRNTPQPASTDDNQTTESAADGAATAEPSDQAVTEGPPDADTAAPASETTADSVSTADAEAPVTFAVNLESDAWMRVTADGEVVYEGTMSAGSQETWTADDELSITAGNSGGVLFSFNGGEERPLGNPGAVSTLTLTPDTDPASLPSP